MTLDAYELKHDYREKWPLANAREYAILSMMKNMLGAIQEEAKREIRKYREQNKDPPIVAKLLVRAELDARLVGLGAGRSDLIHDTYHGVDDAFDIAIYIDGEPCCWIEVTGVDLETDLKPLGENKKQRLLCVGTWKLKKARQFKILDRSWFAFMVSETGKIRFIKASYLNQLAKIEDPVAVYTRLRRKERESVCVRESLWHGPRVFYRELRSTIKKYLIERILR